MVSGPLDLILLVLAGTAIAWIIYRSFLNPRGVFVRSLAGFGIALCVIVAVAILASPLISDAAGLGVFLILCALAVFAAAVALLAVIAAALRRVWDAVNKG